MVPSPRLLGIVALGFVVAALPTLYDAQLWLLFAGGWAGLLLAMGWDLGRLVFARPRIGATLPASVGVGDDFHLAIDLHLPSRTPLRATLRGETEPPLEAVEDVASVLSPGDSCLRLPLRAN